LDDREKTTANLKIRRGGEVADPGYRPWEGQKDEDSENEEKGDAK
jgi:hypothetical protein